MPTPKTAVLMQARNTSERLPGKATVDLGGFTPISLLHYRLVGLNFIWCLANEPATDSIFDAIRPNNHYVGHPTDLVNRRWGAARQFPDIEYFAIAGADDCFLDGEPIHAAFSAAIYGVHDYVQTEGWPVGCNTQVVHRNLLWDAYRFARDDEREHLTLYFDRNPYRYPRHVIRRPGPDRSDVRMTLDTPADLAQMRAIVRDLGAFPDSDALIEWWDSHPDERSEYPLYVPEGTPVPPGHPRIIVGHDPLKGDL